MSSRAVGVDKKVVNWGLYYEESLAREQASGWRNHQVKQMNEAHSASGDGRRARVSVLKRDVRFEGFHRTVWVVALIDERVGYRMEAE